jgi:hypothetical protein
MDELVRKYSIQEISKKTHISPVVLNNLLKKRFEKIPKLKFKGFLQILKNEYPDISFVHLELEGNEFYETFELNNEENQDSVLNDEIEEQNSKLKSYFFVFILLLIIGGLIYHMVNMKEGKVVEKNTTEKKEELKIPEIVVEVNNTKVVELNNTKIDENITEEKSIIQKENNTTINKPAENTEENSVIEDSITQNEENNTILISPHQKVWFRVYFLDDNSTKEYLTSNNVEINGSRNLFIKFGNGLFELNYHKQKIYPNTKKIVRIILKDGEINITKKRLSEFR